MVESLMEIIIYVEDMQAQVAFYRDVLGLSVGYPSGLDDYAEQFWVTFDAGGCVLALHAGGRGRSGPDAPKLVFKVLEIGPARGALLAQGIAMGDVRSPAPGIFVSDGKDPEGNGFSIEAHQAA